MTIEFADRRTTEVHVEDDDETFGPPRVAPDRRAVGWSSLRPEGASYAVPVGVAVFAESAVHHVGCDHGMPWQWAFVGTGRVVLDCAYPHGADEASRQWVDIRSGKVIGTIALDAAHRLPLRAPSWARKSLAP